MVEVIAGFCAAELGPRPLLAGHDLGAELILRATSRRLIRPSRLVLMPNRLHRREEFPARRAAWRAACQAATIPGVDRLMARGAKLVFRPSVGERLSAQRNPGARDLMRHAFADVGGNVNRARSWARFARRWPAGPGRDLLDAYPRLDVPILLLWADQDAAHPLAGAQEALDLLPVAQLQVLAGTGFLMAYDDPVSVGRELIAFCG
jgi:pimeloyl-ACP methyl ester carboxylesterase